MSLTYQEDGSLRDMCCTLFAFWRGSRGQDQKKLGKKSVLHFIKEATDVPHDRSHEACPEAENRRDTGYWPAHHGLSNHILHSL